MKRFVSPSYPLIDNTLEQNYFKNYFPGTSPVSQAVLPAGFLPSQLKCRFFSRTFLTATFILANTFFITFSTASSAWAFQNTPNTLTSHDLTSHNLTPSKLTPHVSSTLSSHVRVPDATEKITASRPVPIQYIPLHQKTLKPARFKQLAATTALKTVNSTVQSRVPFRVQSKVQFRAHRHISQTVTTQQLTAKYSAAAISRNTPNNASRKMTKNASENNISAEQLAYQATHGTSQQLFKVASVTQPSEQFQHSTPTVLMALQPDSGVVTKSLVSNTVPHVSKAAASVAETPAVHNHNFHNTAYQMMAFKAVPQMLQPEEKINHVVMAKRPVFKPSATWTRTGTSSLQLQNPPKNQPRARSLVLQSGISTTNDHIDLTLHKSQILNLRSPAKRLSISDPTAVGVLLISPTQVQLVGKKVGVANLMIWDNPHSSEYTLLDISVQRDVSLLARQLEQVAPGVHVSPMAAQNTVILAGEAETSESAQLALDLAHAFFTTSRGGSGASGNSASGGGAGVSANSSASGNGNSTGSGNGSSASAGGSSGSSGGGSSSGTSASGSNSGGGGTALNSRSPGSSLPGATPNIINLIKVKGIPSTKIEMVQQKLRELDPNIQSSVVPGNNGMEKVILTGKVASAGVVSKAVNLTSLFYGQPGLKVITGPGGNMVRASGNSSFQAQEAFSDNMDINILQGSVVTDLTGNVVSMLEVAHKPQIRCSIKILDISRTALRQLGSNLLGTSGNTTFGSFSGTKSPASGKTIASFVSTDTGAANNLVTTNGARSLTQRFGASQTFGDGITQVLTLNQQFSLALSALEEKRKVRSLAEPTLTFLSGEKASFLAGGEIPIPVLGTQGQISITYHEFGIRLNLIATVTDDGKINMLVAPEVSSVDPANAVTTNVVSVPGFKTRRMQTTLELENGQSFILAGLFNQEETESVSRFPGIGSVPIIGSFFRNSWKDKRENEMVVIIRPEVNYPSNSGPVLSGTNNLNTAPGTVAKADSSEDDVALTIQH